MRCIRRDVGDSDTRYGLSDTKELDEGFIVTATQSNVRNNLKRARESKRVIPGALKTVSITLESILTEETYRQCRYVKVNQLVGLNQLLFVW